MSARHDLLLVLSALLCLIWIDTNNFVVDAFPPLNSKVRLPKTTSQLGARSRRRYYSDEDDYGGGARERQVERPTLTRTEIYGPSVEPSKPKIVVLGASGRIGRLVVQQLLDMPHLDATIVAFVRNYDKACQVLYEDGVMVKRATKEKKRGPQLQIVEGDLIPADELPGFVDDDDEEWKKTAQSAATFYGNDVKDYDNRELLPDSNEALEEAIRGTTTIISCVGSVRPTNLFTDLLKWPVWRILRKDVSGWCRDPRHPYYVHYASTRKVLGLAESEQRRREAAIEAMMEEEENSQSRRTLNNNMPKVPRVRLVRISDLCVSFPPWDFVALVTNALQSIVFRYQEMSEQVLEESNLIDTVVLRPGDLVDDERDVNTTSLQVDSNGRVPCPARVGRADVASLAIAAALFKSEEATTKTYAETAENDDEPFHYKVAVRWSGEEMHPYPPQGTKKDGLADAHQCMNRVLKTERQKKKKKKPLRRRHVRNADDPLPVTLSRHLPRRRRPLKPYGVCVAIPTYFFLSMMFASIAKPLLPYIPGRQWMVPAFTRIRDVLAAMALRYLSMIPIRLPMIAKRVPRSYVPF